MQYTVDYFIQKFEAIPEGEWCTREFISGNKRCARGHCYISLKTHTEIRHYSETSHPIAAEDSALLKLFNSIGESAATVNNGDYFGDDGKYNQPTPKQRILAALYDIKKMQEPKVKEVIRYVSVSASLKKQIELIDN